jgi:acetyl-CoA C-acetyltransferase
MNKIFLIGGTRTPIGKTGGILKNFLPEQLAALVMNNAVNKFGISPGEINLVLLGNAIGPGGNIARVSILEAGWPYHVSGITVDFQCGSGLSAISIAAGQIAAGQADLIIAGGVESTSMAPRRQFSPKDPRFQGEGVFYERAPFSTADVGDPEMGEAAESLAGLKNISREEMDRLALESHRRASCTQNEGLLRDIITPIDVNGKTIHDDECIRPSMNLELLERMPPAFINGGRVTAGNACLKHDGAAVLLLASEKAVKKYNLNPEAVILNTAINGCNPNVFPLGPVSSINKLMQNADLVLEDIDAFEINEAFAVKVLACSKELGISLDKTNILGGALAYGHPYGASGAIILLHLLKALKKINGRLGVASIGVAGGQGLSVLIERCS